MSTDKPIKADPARARPDRATAELGERKRRRTNFDASFDLALPLDEARLDRKNFTYRWFNDTPGRVAKHTNLDDWEKVSAEEAGVQTEHHVGYQRDGTSMKAILMKKPLKWHDEDQARKIVRSREFETEQMASVGNDLGANGYVPKNIENRIRAGSSRSEVPDLAGAED